MPSRSRLLLLVEDELLISMLQQRILTQAGYRVLPARDPGEAFALFRGHKDIDLVLMDIDLGSEIDGTAVAQSMLAERDVPIVFLSSHVDPETIEKSEHVSSYGYILKSAGDTMLLSQLRMAFRLYESAHRLKAVGHELAEVERRSDFVLDAMEMPALLVDKWICAQANDAAARLFSVSSKDALKGRSVEEFLPEMQPNGDSSMHVLLGKTRASHLHGEAPFRFVVRSAEGADTPVEATIMHMASPQDSLVFCVLRPLDFGKGDRRKNPSSFISERAERHVGLATYTLFIQEDRWECSPVLLEIFGIDSKAQRNTSLWLSLIHQDDRTTAQKHLHDTVLLEHHTFDLEYRIVRASDGAVRWLHGFGELEFDEQKRPLYMYGIIQDITEYKELSVSFQRRSEILEDYFERSPNLLFFTDMQGLVSRTNPTWNSLFGTIPADERNKDLVSMINSDDRNKMFEALERLRGGYKVDPFLARIADKDGTTHWMLWSLSRSADLCFGLAQDLDERLNAENVLQKSVEEREALLGELRHRVKNSFTQIMGLFELELLQPLEPASLEALRSLKSRVASLSDLYTHLDHNQGFGGLRVDQYLNTIIHGIEESWVGAKSRISIASNIHKGFMKIEHAASIGLIINELLTNALKHAFPGNLEGRIDIDLRCDTTMLKLCVRNNGVPAPDDRLSKSKGLGIQLVKSLAEQLGGRMNWSSSFSETMFTVDFPNLSCRDGEY